MALLEGRDLRKTYRLGKGNSWRRCGASMSGSKRVRWSPSWDRRDPARAP